MTIIQEPARTKYPPNVRQHVEKKNNTFAHIQIKLAQNQNIT